MLAFRLLLLSVTSLLVYADDVTTSIPTDLPVLLTIAPHQDDTDASSENQRQGRMSLHAELPASKAKREQALRNILAAKRRQVMGQRPSDQQRSVIVPRPRGHIPKDVADVLEVQESRHGLYIAAPSGAKTEIAAEEEAPEPLTKTFVKTTSEQPSLVEGIDKMTYERPEPINQTMESKDLGHKNRTSVGTEVRKSSSGILRTGYSSSNRNNTYHLQRIIPTKSTQINGTDPRKNNNTVIMSESLYKHFRPVESNVPIEEMTQFLYFGQKLSPETQNTTSSNSLEVTPTLPPIVSSRRRFSMKRFSTTTPVPVPRLEEIINEEMNIAVERQTVERNKIPKIKNAFRSPSASSLYYRKSPVRPVDPTIVSNVIGLPETKNVSEGGTISKNKNDSRHEEHPTSPSAHASLIHQVRGAVLDDAQGQGKGNSTSHDTNTSGNAAREGNSTQILNETRDRGSTINETKTGESEVRAKPTLPMSKTEEIRASIIRDGDHVSINGHSSGYPLRNFTSLDSKDNNLDATVQISSTDSPDREKGTTLRIIVTEISDGRKTWSKVNNDRVNLASPGGSPPVVLPAQQHVYAYTITNVTRLLRNYSGPGVSSKEEGEQQGPAPAGTAEISDGSSSGIVATRSRSDLSAGPAAEGVTTLEGEQVNQNSGDYSPRSDADAASRGPTSIQTLLEVNKTVVKVVDSEAGESIRADALPQSFGSPVSTDPENEKNLRENLRDVDQRMLQKSASAVLNQRPSDEPIGDRVIGKGTRRRHHFRVLKNQGRNTSVKSEGDDAVIRQPMPREEPNKSSGVRSITSKTSNESLQSTRPTDNVMQYHTSLRDSKDPQGVNGMRNFEENFGKITPDMLADQPMKKYSDMTDRRAASDIQVSDITMTPLEVTTLQQDESNDEKLKSKGDDKPGSFTTPKVETSSANSNSSEIDVSAVPSDRDKVVSAGSVEAKSRATDRKLETATTSPKETITVQSTMPPPVFPVTPRILSNFNEPDKNGDVPNTDDSVTEVPVIRTTNLTEANRPFGIAEDLSPSEIQKMYRSSNTVRPEVGTTLKPEVQMPAKNFQGEGEGESPMTVTKFNASLSDENWNSQQAVSIERSPEVRGRNLSDKTRDKDDILPIMHLYNTTSIFNETSSLTTSSSSHGTETDHVILPAAAKKDEADEKWLDSVTTALPTANSVPGEEKVEGIIHDNAPLAGHNSGSQRLPDSLLNKPGYSTRQREDQGSREPVGPSYSNKGSNFTTGAGTNKTRHKHPHQTTASKLNASAYDPTLNITDFGSNGLSPRLRDPVNISEVISKRHEGDTIATQETVAVVSYILATLVVFPIAVGVGLILRRLIIRNRKMLEESDTSSEISCKKDALNLENGDFKTSIEKAITKLPRIQHLCHEAEKPPPPPTQESRWEFPRDKLRLQTVLGQGNFGQVWKAEADDLTGHQGTTRLVAVKTVKEGASSREKEDLVRELEIMQQLGNHPNVVTLLGCCTEEEPHYLILEYVMYGKLLAYLRDHRTRQDFYNFSEDSAALTSRDLTVFGYCVARGMEYLASKKIIHRDLAARNVLVDHNKLCKIADFGMSRFANEDGEVIETRHGRNALPIRWMAPESLIYSLFTTKTDVWSFGILMWEIVTLGSTPYPDMTAREVMRNVQSGYRLERPSHCRSELFRVISRCWQADPDRRPEFQVLRRDLAQLLEDNMNGHYVDLESFASECTD